ncbi:MAG: SEC-C metal-binding domain-containing protein, partial [Opitutaceae bacterium]
VGPTDAPPAGAPQITSTTTNGGTTSSQPPQPPQEIQLPKITIRRELPKVGRNEQCPCGSGKKFKNCHGA